MMKSLSAKRLHWKYKASILITASTLLAITLAEEGGYELLFGSNSSEEALPRDVFEAGIGEDAKLLDYYKCNGREHELFPPMPVVNEKRDSLRLQEDDGDKLYVYREGNYYTPEGELTKVKGYFNKTIARALAKLEKLPTGRRILRELEQSRYPLTIAYSTWPAFNAVQDGVNYLGMGNAQAVMFAVLGKKINHAKIQHLGNGGKIQLMPEAYLTRMESDGEKREIPLYLSLAHEAFHAYDGIRGLLDTRSVWAPGRYEGIPLSEYRAVNFENLIRKESGLRYAIHYGNYEFGDTDVLDDQGNPEILPTPCLP